MTFKDFSNRNNVVYLSEIVKSINFRFNLEQLPLSNIAVEKNGIVYYSSVAEQKFKKNLGVYTSYDYLRCLAIGLKNSGKNTSIFFNCNIEEPNENTQIINDDDIRNDVYFREFCLVLGGDIIINNDLEEFNDIEFGDNFIHCITFGGLDVFYYVEEYLKTKLKNKN